MYVRMCIYVSIHLYIRTYTICVYVCPIVRTCMQRLNVCSYIRTYLPICVYVCTCMCVHVCDSPKQSSVVTTDSWLDPLPLTSLHDIVGYHSSKWRQWWMREIRNHGLCVQNIYNPHQWPVTGCYDISNIPEGSEMWTTQAISPVKCWRQTHCTASMRWDVWEGYTYIQGVSCSLQWHMRSGVSWAILMYAYSWLLTSRAVARNTKLPVS